MELLAPTERTLKLSTENYIFSIDVFKFAREKIGFEMIKGLYRLVTSIFGNRSYIFDKFDLG